MGNDGVPPTIWTRPKLREQECIFILTVPIVDIVLFTKMVQKLLDTQLIETLLLIFIVR